MSKKVLYIRIRGRVLGPFDVSQLKGLHQRGQFHRFHEVSEDRKQWFSASKLEEVFSAGEGGLALEEPFPQAKRPESGDNGPSIVGPSSSVATEWYYADAAGKQNGPVSSEDLLRLIGKGEISSDTLVWKEGMANWLPLSSPEAGFPNLPVKPRRRKISKRLVFVGLVIGFFILFLGIGFLIVKWTGWGQGANSRSKNQEDEITIKRLKDPATPQEITEAYKDRVFQIKVAVPGPVKISLTTGSGIQIANNRRRGLMATNRHVLAPGKFDGPVEPDAAAILNVDVAIRNSSQLNYKPARVAAYHRRLDVALLITELDGEKPSATPILRKKSLDQGEVAVALGYPRGLEFFTSNGIISNTSGKGGFIWTTCPVSPGNSGGPLLIARHGYLVGINTVASKAEFAQNVNGAVPAEEIVSPLKAEQTENWVWSEELKDLTLELIKTIPVEE